MEYVAGSEYSMTRTPDVAAVVPPRQMALPPSNVCPRGCKQKKASSFPLPHHTQLILHCRKNNIVLRFHPSRRPTGPPQPVDSSLS
ncbi:hypothetical protein E2C01_012290 [Portunus trituberculatus]|uniref:Uncharacterized protein n=1 Tax=Portunus trituberculatus TaxID=210409 RepID=A0A5B7DDJ8_PORTR|nr:hypothetical protein [Portunus trituberculatus]